MTSNRRTIQYPSTSSKYALDGSRYRSDSLRLWLIPSRARLAALKRDRSRSLPRSACAAPFHRAVCSALFCGSSTSRRCLICWKNHRPATACSTPMGNNQAHWRVVPLLTICSKRPITMRTSRLSLRSSRGTYTAPALPFRSRKRCTPWRCNGRMIRTFGNNSTSPS